MSASIAVLGAGVIGLSTAVCLKRCMPSLNIIVITKSTSPDTCTDVAAGIWEPFILQDTPVELQRKWSKATWDLATELIKRDDASEIGVSTCSGYNLFDYNIEKLPDWQDLVPSIRKLTDKDLSQFPEKYKSGFFLTTYIIEGTRYLLWLKKCFLALGGKIKIEKVDSFEQVAGYDIVINCTGFGARDLCKDSSVQPVRGQVMRVKAPWIRHFYLCELTEINRMCYIIPNNDSVVLGGTAQHQNFDLTVNKDDTDHIIKETQLIKPDLVNATRIRHAVGLRPSRNSIRLEKEDYILQRNEFNKSILKIIHNYGHGGAGITTHWGCAMDAVQRTRETLKEVKATKSQL